MTTQQIILQYHETSRHRTSSGTVLFAFSHLTEMVVFSFQYMSEVRTSSPSPSPLPRPGDRRRSSRRVVRAAYSFACIPGLFALQRVCFLDGTELTIPSHIRPCIDII